MTSLGDKKEQESVYISTDGRVSENQVFWNLAMTAKVLGVHRTTVIRWLREGKIPGKQLGKHFFFNRDLIIKHLSSGEEVSE